MLGRFLRFIGDEFRDLMELLGGSQNARIIVIAAVALLVLAIAGRIVVGRRLEIRRRTANSLQIVGSSRRDYWALAAELEQRGDFVAASHALYLAVLDALSRSGGVTFHSSKTVGDYVRDLRQRRSPFSDAFRDIRGSIRARRLRRRGTERGDLPPPDRSRGVCRTPRAA